MNKSVLLSVIALCFAVFAFMSPATASDMPAGYDTVVADASPLLVPQEPSLTPAVIVATELQCPSSATACVASYATHEPATLVTPGGASAGIVLATAVVGPGDGDEDPDADIRT